MKVPGRADETVPGDPLKNVPPGEAYILDGDALLCYLVDGPGASRVEHLLKLAQDGQARVMISALDLYDMYSRVRELAGREGLAEASYVIRQLPLEVVSLSPEDAEEACDVVAETTQRGGPATRSGVARYYCRKHGWTLVAPDPKTGEVRVVRP